MHANTGLCMGQRCPDVDVDNAGSDSDLRVKHKQPELFFNCGLVSRLRSAKHFW